MSRTPQSSSDSPATPDAARPSPRGTSASPHGTSDSWPWLRVLAWVAVATALALSFAAYLQPGMVVELGNRLWSCF